MKLKTFAIVVGCLGHLGSVACAAPAAATKLKSSEYLGHELIADLKTEVERFVSPCKDMPPSKEFTFEPMMGTTGSVEYACAGGLRMLQFVFAEKQGVRYIDRIQYGHGPKGKQPFTQKELDSLRQAFLSRVKTAYGLKCEAPKETEYWETSTCSSTAVKLPPASYVELEISKLLLDGDVHLTVKIDRKSE